MSSDDKVSLPELRKTLRNIINLNGEGKLQIGVRIINEADGEKYVLGYCQKVTYY